METIYLIVECAEDAGEVLSELGSVKYSLPLINACVVEVPPENMSKLSDMPGVIRVSQVSAITTQMQSARKTVLAETAKTLGYTGRGVTVAILDTGVSPVDDLILPCNRIIAFKDFVNNQKEPYDDNGHGTHVGEPYP